MANHPIFAPAFHGDVEKVKTILDEDNSLVSVRDAKNLTPLHVAASRGQHVVVQLLIDYGADVQGPTETGGWTPLVFAAYRGHFDAAKVLLENGAGVTSEEGNPIHFAGQRKHKDICRILVEYGAIDDLFDSKDLDVLNLFRSVYSYGTESVQEILERRPELVHFKDKKGRTALHESCANGDTKTVRVLLKFRADPNIRDSNGLSAMERASTHNQHAVIKILEKHKSST